MSYRPFQRAAATALLTPALLFPLAARATTDAEIAELRAMIDQMKAQYETRISELETRLANAERTAARPAPEPATRDPAESRPMTAPSVMGAKTGEPPKSVFGSLGSGNAFNPQIAVILNGNYYQDDIDGEGATLVGEAYQPGSGGHDHAADDGHAHGMTENGFNFQEAELSFSGTVDPYFDASLYLSVDGYGNVDLEEGWFQTRSLPYGLRIKGGKFLSDFGYINRQHPHQWDFVDQNLPYLNLLGVHGLNDTGLQFTWLTPLPVYTLVGMEALTGDQEVFGATVSDAEQAELNLGKTKDGPQLWTAFAKMAPDIGRNHALQFGVSYAHANQQQLVLGHTHAEDATTVDDHDHAEMHADDGHMGDVHEPLLEIEQETGLAGEAGLWGIDLVYKYDGGGAHGKGDVKFQSEYLRSIKDLDVRASAHEEALGSSRKYTTDGLYAQAIYGFAPKWTAGLRYDVLGLTNKVSGGVNERFGASDRWTLDVSWSLSEFSRLRAQYAYNDILVEPNQRERFNAFYLQFLMSLGSHGSHRF